MRAYRTEDPSHDADRANPYRELLAQGPPSTRPRGDGVTSPAGMQPADAASPAGSSPRASPPAPDGSRPSADGAPSPVAHGGAGAPVTGPADAGHVREAVKVVLPGELSARRPDDPVSAVAPAAPDRPAATEMPSRPGATAPAAAQSSTRPTTNSSRRRAPRRFRRYYKSAAWLVLGLGIGGFFLAGVAIDRLGAWDHEVPLQEDTTLSFPRSAERWIWLPEEHLGDIVCTGTDGGGANLPMRPALGYDHDDYSSAYRFPTGDGSVTLRCNAAPSPATAGWTPSGVETVRVAEPVDRSRDVPFLQAALIVTLGGPALGILMFVGTLLTQIVTGIAALVTNVRRKRGRRRQPSAQAGSR